MTDVLVNSEPCNSEVSLLNHFDDSAKMTRHLTYMAKMAEHYNTYRAQRKARSAQRSARSRKLAAIRVMLEQQATNGFDVIGALTKVSN
jgi:hypothetical protein